MFQLEQKNNETWTVQFTDRKRYFGPAAEISAYWNTPYRKKAKGAMFLTRICIFGNLASNTVLEQEHHSPQEFFFQLAERVEELGFSAEIINVILEVMDKYR